MAHSASDQVPTMKSRIILAVSITLIVYGLIASIVNTNFKIELKKLDIKTKQVEINDLNKQIDKLNDSKQSDSERVMELKRENSRLQGELQAKLDKQAQQARNAVYADTVQPTGDWVAQCQTWANQAGIALDSYAIKLIERESHCNNYAQNPSSTAYGIGQFLDTTWAGQGCVKTSNAIIQIRCMNSYVIGRYGSYQAALNHSYTVGWY